MSPIRERVRIFETVTAAMRVCQLHVIFNILLILQGPILYGLTLLVWLTTRAVDLFVPFPYPPPDPALAWGARPWFEVFPLIGSIAAYTTFATARPRLWAVILAGLALTASLVQLIGWMWGAPVREAMGSLVGVEALALTSGALLFAGAMITLHLSFFWLIIRGYRALNRASEVDRIAIAETSGGFGPLCRGLLMMPEAIRFARHPKLTAMLMSLAGVAGFMNVWRLGYALIILAMMPLIGLMFADPFRDTVLIMGQDGDFLKGFGFFLIVCAMVAILFGFLLAIYILIRVFSRAALNRARRHMSRTLAEVQALDPRAPILFLRSFIDDQVPLHPPQVGWAARLLDGAALETTLDHVMLGEGSHFGPTVALGSPDDVLPPYGAARGYFHHGDWKQAVNQLATDAAHIVIVLDETPGVAWEVQALHRNDHLSKTLFMVSPARVGAEGARLMGAALASYDLTVPQDIERAFGFYMVGNKVELLITPRPAPYAYVVAIRQFFRRKA